MTDPYAQVQVYEYPVQVQRAKTLKRWNATARVTTVRYTSPSIFQVARRWFNSTSYDSLTVEIFIKSPADPDTLRRGDVEATVWGAAFGIELTLELEGHSFEGQDQVELEYRVAEGEARDAEMFLAKFAR